MGFGGEIRQEEIFEGDESAPKLDCSNVCSVINLLNTSICIFIINKFCGKQIILQYSFFKKTTFK